VWADINALVQLMWPNGAVCTLM